MPTPAASTTISGKPLGLATAHASTLVGLEAHAIRVEVCCTRGPAFFQLVGLAEAAVREARVRVSSALARLGVLLDEHAVTVSLAPADLRKSGAGLDLAIALGLLGALGKVPETSLDDTLMLGELSLDGRVQPVRGVLPQLAGARSRGLRQAVVPSGNSREAGLVGGLEVLCAERLEDLVAHLREERPLPAVPPTVYTPRCDRHGLGDLEDLRGQTSARRALEVAAAGNHNLLMVGPPGSGKTMLARLLPTILPPLSFDEALEVTAIHSVAGLLRQDAGALGTRPFRAPHHSVSVAGLVGGGEVPRPGELSLAHHGVLFLDELAEFQRGVIEALRQPLEDGRVCIARSRAHAWFPARPLVVAAVNPCMCGYYGHPSRRCRCTPRQRQSYQSRLSGPLLDRLDIHVALPPVEPASLVDHARSESSAAVAERVLAARAVQRERCTRGVTSTPTNSTLTRRDTLQVARLCSAGRRLVEQAMVELGLSARAYLRVLRTARTIADLEASESVQPAHLAEAVQGRLLDLSAAA